VHRDGADDPDHPAARARSGAGGRSHIGDGGRGTEIGVVGGDEDRDALKAESAGSYCSSPSGGVVSLGWEPIKTPSCPLSPDSTSVIVLSILTPLASPFPSLSHLALVLRRTTSPSAGNQFSFMCSVTPSSPSPLPRLLKYLFIDRMMHVHSFPFRLLGEIMVGGGISDSPVGHI